jgi:hypothetical protein
VCAGVCAPFKEPGGVGTHDAEMIPQWSPAGEDGGEPGKAPPSWPAPERAPREKTRAPPRTTLAEKS